MTNAKYFMLLFILSGLNRPLFSQGCSDAGICSINNFKPTTNDSIQSYRNNLIIGISNGKGDHSVTVLSSFIEYNYQFSENFNSDFKLTYTSLDGNHIRSSGFSDIYFNIKYTFTNNIQLTIGTKIPFNDGNKSREGLTLPMDYQYSLGTLDLILGIGYEYNKLKMVFALQQPLTQNNNQFSIEKYPENSIFRLFQSTNKYKRSGDILFRASYPIYLGARWTITPNILPIYHLTEDKFTDSNNIEKRIPGSNGLTFNGNIYLEYSVNKSGLIELNFGIPFITRKARPDGLKRSYVLTLAYIFKF